ncbi:hypothetical protein KY342_03470 [Candidatus Woesearchaeota archaeon]|nr:hypothetical protein [Candidatus Woesearchaeota archaeon]
MSRQKLRQIIEDLTTRYDVNSMDTNDFYRAIIGVHNKEYHPLSYSEFDEHKRGLFDAGINTYSYGYGESFLIYNHDLEIGRNIRFYLNAHNAENARKIIVEAAKGLGDERRFRIKTIGNGNYGYERYDNIVVYVNANDDAKYFANFLKELSNNNKELFDDDVPFPARKIAKGFGYGTSILKRTYIIFGNHIRKGYSVSFNSLHGSVLNLLFSEFRKREISDLDEKTELYAQALEQACFDPDNMHLIIGMEDPLKDV